MRPWIELGADLNTAATLADISESELHRWQVIAETHPEGQAAGMLRDLAQAETQAAARYPDGNGARPPTGNIVGGPNGQPAAAQLLVRWDD